MRFSQLNILIISSLACGAAWGQIDRTLAGTVTSAEFGTRYVLSSAWTGNLTWDKDPAGSGRTVLRSRVRATDAKVAGVLRTDFLPKGEASQTGMRWYGLSVYFPANWAVHPNPVVVAQVDQQQPSGLPPPMAIVVRGSALEMNLAFNHRPLSGAAEIATPANTAVKVFKLGPLQTGKWYCFAVRSEWSTTLGSGSLVVYQNRDKVFEGQRDINSYPGAGGTVPRVGQMYPGLMGVSERNIYADFIRLGGPTTTLEQVLAETPCKTTTTTTALVK